MVNFDMGLSENVLIYWLIIGVLFMLGIGYVDG